MKNANQIITEGFKPIENDLKQRANEIKTLRLSSYKFNMIVQELRGGEVGNVEFF